MKIDVSPTFEELSEKAAALVETAATAKPDLLLCAATGGSPTGLYKRMAAAAEAYQQLRVIKLDEWGGLPLSHPATCESYLRQHLLEPLTVSDERYAGFNSQSEDPESECGRMSDWLADNGPIDVCILGLGMNGHLGLNEPSESLQPRAHLATLSDESRQHDMLKDIEGGIAVGLTLGMAELFNSKTIILLVNGAHKSDIFASLLKAEISTSLPASLLWLHPDVQCFCDREAMAKS
ncbi:MAG: galactosamine-6-phosphate isomerase [Planctomycetota bacterium]|nr:galactosamine-6-phosphate isomerase [Planctomycetota bacterium]MDA1141545.1 galactosamine-6-phosphate isomerase [Planctomycetota bacterium]